MTPKKSFRGKSDDAMQVLCSASAQQNYLHNTSTPIEEKALMLFKLCSASAQQNYLHNTSTAIEEKAVVLFKCCAAHRHNKTICTTHAQQSMGKDSCYGSVVQRIGTTKLFAQHKHSNRGKSGGAIQVLCSTSAQQNLVVRLLCTPQSVVHSICTTKNRGWRRDSRCQRGKKFVRD